MSRRSPPRRDEQPDLFAATFADIPIRDQRDTMERPCFSLSKKPRMEPIEYEVGDVWIRVTPSAEHGMATIWDADILIWAVTQLKEALDRGMNCSPTVQFHPYDLLKSIRRSTGGKDYARLRAALERLTHTAVKTNIRAKGRRRYASFHWIEGWTETVDEATGETMHMTLTLPQWLYEGVVMSGGVLTIHEDYFLLTGGIERWLYRVARKHGGHQALGWRFTMRQLYEKSGSSARFSDFALDVRKIVKGNALPEYTLSLHRNDEGEEVVSFVRRSKLDVMDPEYRTDRFPGRRLGQGIHQDGVSFGSSVKDAGEP